MWVQLHKPYSGIDRMLCPMKPLTLSVGFEAQVMNAHCAVPIFVHLPKSEIPWSDPNVRTRSSNVIIQLDVFSCPFCLRNNRMRECDVESLTEALVMTKVRIQSGVFSIAYWFYGLRVEQRTNGWTVLKSVRSCKTVSILTNSIRIWHSS